MRIFIPLICYNHTCFTEWMMSIIKLVNFTRDNSIDMSFYPIFFESLIPRARNSAAAHFLEDEQNTHLLFIDADIIFEPEDVLKLIQADKDVIGGIYPKKRIMWNRLKQNPNEECVNFPMGGRIALKDGLIQVDYLPTGFLMVKREAILKIIKKHPHLKYRNHVDKYHDARDHFYDLFRVGVNNNLYESEDWGFCSLWRETGGQLFIHPEVNVKHVGWHTYEGNLLKYLKESGKL